MNLCLSKKSLAIPVAILFVSSSQAGTWGTMNFNNGKWGATPDVYTITLVETGYNTGSLVVTFTLDGTAAIETAATSFSVTCGGVTVVSTGSPVTLTGLTVDVGYSCTVVATNGTGSSSASTGVIGTPAERDYSSSILKIIMMKQVIDSSP